MLRGAVHRPLSSLGIFLSTRSLRLSCPRRDRVLIRPITTGVPCKAPVTALAEPVSEPAPSTSFLHPINFPARPPPLEWNPPSVPPITDAAADGLSGDAQPIRVKLRAPARPRRVDDSDTSAYAEKPPSGASASLAAEGNQPAEPAPAGVHVQTAASVAQPRRRRTRMRIGGPQRVVAAAGPRAHLEAAFAAAIAEAGEDIRMVGMNLQRRRRSRVQIADERRTLRAILYQLEPDGGTGPTVGIPWVDPPSLPNGHTHPQPDPLISKVSNLFGQKKRGSWLERISGAKARAAAAAGAGVSPATAGGWEPWDHPWSWYEHVMSTADMPLPPLGSSQGLRYRARLPPEPPRALPNRDLSPTYAFPTGPVDMERVKDVVQQVVKPREEVDAPRLLHGLEQVLFSPGIHPMRDLHSCHLNFPPYLERVHPTEIVDYSNISAFVTASRDPELHTASVGNGCRLQGSTSSVSPLLAHIYFSMSRFKPLNTAPLSSSFSNLPATFTRAVRKPVAVCLRPMDNDVYSIDSLSLEKFPHNIVLVDLGRSMEKMLTMSPEEFCSKLIKQPRDGVSSGPLSSFDEPPQAFSYLKVDELMLRSQLDCHHPSLPHSKVFDLKSRATMPVRLDCLNYKDHLSYAITELYGHVHSFEREFYDMLRSCFIKYCLQLRIGQMDGAFVTYHNTDRVFGFEYVPIREMEQYVFGSVALAERSFEITTRTLMNMVNTLVSIFPGATLRVIACSHSTKQEIDVFVQRVNNDRGWGEYDPDELMDFTAVHKFKLRLQTFVNGSKMGSSLNFGPGDQLDVFYSFEEMHSTPGEYREMIRRAMMRQ